MQRSASAGGSVDLLTTMYGLLFATKTVREPKSLAIKPEKTFSRTFRDKPVGSGTALGMKVILCFKQLRSNCLSLVSCDTPFYACKTHCNQVLGSRNSSEGETTWHSIEPPVLALVSMGSVPMKLCQKATFKIFLSLLI